MRSAMQRTFAVRAGGVNAWGVRAGAVRLSGVMVLPPTGWHLVFYRRIGEREHREMRLVLWRKEGIVLGVSGSYFFSPASQLRTNVSGAASCASGTRNKKRLPSGEGAHRPPEAPVGA